MGRTQFKKVTFEFPSDEYVFLRMACAKKGVTMKEFITSSVMKTIDEYEDELDAKSLNIVRENNENTIPWNEAEKILGWDKI